MSFVASVTVLILSAGFLMVSVLFATRIRKLASISAYPIEPKVASAPRGIIGRLVRRRIRKWVSRSLESMRATLPAQACEPYLADWLVSPTCDASVMAMGCLKAKSELEQIGANRLHRDQWFHDSPLAPESRIKLIDTCKNFLIEEEGGIFGVLYSLERRQSSLHAIDAYARVVAPPILSEPRAMEDSEWPRTAEGFYHLLKSKFWDSSSLFKIEINEPPSVFATHAGVSLIRNITPVLDDDKRKSLEELWRKAMDGLLVRDLYGDRDGLFGYFHDGSAEPCICTTEWVYRMDFLYRQRFGQPTDLSKLLKRNTDGILRLMQECQGEDSLGFSRSPNQKHATTPIHTRAALQLIRMMLCDEVIDFSRLDWLQPGRIQSFIAECRSEEGFSNRPGEMPMLGAARSAANVYKVLEIFRTNGLFAESLEYFHFRHQLRPSIVGLSKFVESCYGILDQKAESDDLIGRLGKGSYWQFPPKYAPSSMSSSNPEIPSLRRELAK